MNTQRQSAKYYRKNRKYLNKKAIRYYYKNKAKVRRRHKLYLKDSKITVLTHYGKNGKLQCCWSGCSVTDIDMLTLDHIENGGARHRKKHSGGANIYPWASSHDFPTGFQTLCWNHQWKKELDRRREIAAF